MSITAPQLSGIILDPSVI